MKRKLHILVDSLSYVQSEIYQHQLHRILVNDYDCVYHEINSLNKLTIESSDIVFSALKLRTLYRNSSLVAKSIGDARIIVQDYDPWVSFEDDSQFKGAYFDISKNVNALFFVPSFEWANLITKKGLKCVASKIGMLPSYCDNTSWENRKIELEFRGAHYPSRDKAMERLFQSEFPYCWKKGTISPYQDFLKHLSNIKIWAFSDSEKIVVDGETISKNALWPKCMEILSRGCFLIRDWQPEAENYVKDIPTAFTFKDEKDALSNLRWIQNMPDDILNDYILDSVNKIRKENCYKVISDKLQEWYEINE